MSFGKNATCIIVLQGYVVNIVRGQTRINCPTAGIFNLKWKNNTIPYGVKKGKYVTIVGKPITLDLGRANIIASAELLQASSLKEIKSFVEGKKHGQKAGVAADKP